MNPSIESDPFKDLTEVGRKTDDTMYTLLQKGISNEFFEAVKFLIAIGGKRVRPSLTLLFCELAGGSQEDAYGPAAGIELLHNYSLIVDDIIDNSTLRRGSPTVWKKYGLPIALLIGMHYREAAFEATKAAPNPDHINEIFSDAIRQMLEGERLDILFEQAGRDDDPYIPKHRYTEVSRTAYMEMIGCKTAGLIKVACEAGVLCAAGASKELFAAASEYGWAAGLAFQLIDDYLDLFAHEDTFGKEIGKDIKEHKLGNLAVIYALDELENTQKMEVLNILRQNNPRSIDVANVITLIKNTSGPERVLNEAKDLSKQAKQALAPFPDSEAKTMLERVVTFIVERTY